MHPTKHMALEHLQAVDVPLHGASTPGQGHPGFDRRIVLIQSQGKAANRLRRTGSCALEPGIKRLRLALTDQGGKILRQRDRLGDLGRLHMELGELLGLGGSALRCAARRSTSQLARRGVKGQHDGSATAGSGWRALRYPEARPWTCRNRWT